MKLIAVFPSILIFALPGTALGIPTMQQAHHNEECPAVLAVTTTLSDDGAAPTAVVPATEAGVATAVGDSFVAGGPESADGKLTEPNASLYHQVKCTEGDALTAAMNTDAEVFLKENDMDSHIFESVRDRNAKLLQRQGIRIEHISYHVHDIQLPHRRDV